MALRTHAARALSTLALDFVASSLIFLLVGHGMGCSMKWQEFARPTASQGTAGGLVDLRRVDPGTRRDQGPSTDLLSAP